MKTITFKVDDECAAMIEGVAKEEDRPRSNFMAVLMKDILLVRTGVITQDKAATLNKTLKSPNPTSSNQAVISSSSSDDDSDTLDGDGDYDPDDELAFLDDPNFKIDDDDSSNVDTEE